MIYRLRRKFIRIVTLSFVSVFLILLLSIYLFTTIQTNASLDDLADVISANNGTFPNFDNFTHGSNHPFRLNGIDKEVPFTTRFFTVRFDSSGRLVSADIRSIASVTREEAVQYADEVLYGSRERGWKNDFRYKRYDTGNGTAVVFINGANIKRANQGFIIAATTVFLICGIVIILLIILISKKAVKPVAESYEKQKQFITDANHELKTPLTLIRTNLDIMESESGANEWLSDIREETEIMTELVNRLVTLARMDEDQNELNALSFNLSNAVTETVSIFTSAIEKSQKQLSVDIASSVGYIGDEASIRQVISILMDNAVKYCDEGGTICVSLCGGKHPVLTVDNTYSSVGSIELSRLFDRFYRADKARTYGSGFGVGLSIAKASVEKHRGNITVRNLGNEAIRFQVKL